MNLTGKLTQDHVTAVFEDCLYYENTATELVVAEGVMGVAAFNPEQIDERRHEIAGMLGELSTKFRLKGGYSFLKACLNADSRIWTRDYDVVDQLVQLGIAADLIQYGQPREQWSSCPGGRPYIMIK